MNLWKLCFVFMTSICFLTSCQMTQYHTAKSLKKGERAFVVGVDSRQSSAWAKPASNREVWQRRVFHSMPFAPSIHCGWGTNKRFDHTFAYSIGNGFSYALKWQFLGDQDSKFAAAIRPEFGLNPFSLMRQIDRNAYAQFPLLLTFQPSDKHAFTVSPQFTFAFPGYRVSGATPAERYLQEQFFSQSLSYHLGEKNKWVFAFANTITDDFSLNVQLSVGRIWYFQGKKYRN